MERGGSADCGDGEWILKAFEKGRIDVGEVRKEEVEEEEKK